MRKPMPEEGDTVHIVDEEGATFAFMYAHDADAYAEKTKAAGDAINLKQFTLKVPRDGMTWEEIADYAASNGENA